jgi:hypothetical protein
MKKNIAKPNFKFSKYLLHLNYIQLFYVYNWNAIFKMVTYYLT